MLKMRNMTPIFIWGIVIALGIIFTLGDTNLFSVLGTGPDNVGGVNGYSIGAEQYQNLIQSYTEYYNEQGAVIDDETQARLENDAWNSLVNQYIIDGMLKEIGIEITDEEIITTIESANPPEMVQQYFKDSSGVFRPEYIQQTILDPRYNDFWVYIENALRQQEREQKFNLFLRSSFVSSNLEVQKAIKREKISYDIRYIRVPYAEISDSLIQISEEMIATSYQNKNNQFNQEKRYLFDYVSFSIAPKKIDTVNTLDDFTTFYRPEFRKSTNDSLFFDINKSQAPYSIKTVRKRDIREEYGEVLTLENNEISEVIIIAGQFHLLKKLSSDDSIVTFLDFSRSLNIDETVDNQLRLADDFYIYAKGDGFDQETERENLPILQGTATEDNPFVVGLGNSYQVINFLDIANEGDISPPYRIRNQVVVLRLYRIQPEGVRPLDDVRSEVEGMVRNRVRKNMLIERLNSHNSSVANSSIEDWGQQLSRDIESLSINPIQNYAISSLGREPYLLGWLESMKEGQISPIIEGEFAAYILHLDKISIRLPEQDKKEQKKIIEKRIAGLKQQSFLNNWLDIVRSQADITDNRRYFIQ